MLNKLSTMFMAVTLFAVTMPMIATGGRDDSAAKPRSLATRITETLNKLLPKPSNRFLTFCGLAIASPLLIILLPVLLPLVLTIATLAFVGFFLISLGLFLIPIFGFVTFLTIVAMLFGNKTVENGATTYTLNYGNAR